MVEIYKTEDVFVECEAFIMEGGKEMLYEIKGGIGIFLEEGI